MHVALACKLTNFSARPEQALACFDPSTYSLSSFVYLDSTSNSTATLSVCTCARLCFISELHVSQIRISEHVWTTSTCCSSYKHTHIYGEFKRGPGWVLAGASFTLCLGLFGTGPAPGDGGFPIQIGGGFLYNTYPDVSCMYPACILHVF
jgi:hypothetical protein